MKEKSSANNKNPLNYISVLTHKDAEKLQFSLFTFIFSFFIFIQMKIFSLTEKDFSCIEQEDEKK